ncbi:MAG TPA: hypothetical protein VGN95_13195, partial [Pyrinomonadaceae bacterium]|nr:hypothetical protein [Pyrinomonadaceae bacterium]
RKNSAISTTWFAHLLLCHVRLVNVSQDAFCPATNISDGGWREERSKDFNVDAETNLARLSPEKHALSAPCSGL